jgi:hypothetical protein
VVAVADERVEKGREDRAAAQREEDEEAFETKRDDEKW